MRAKARLADWQMAQAEPATFQLTEAEAVEAVKFVTHRRLFRQHRFGWIIAALVVVTICAIAMQKDVIAGAALFALLVAPIWLGVLLFWLVPRHAKRHYRQSVTMKDQNELTWDDAGLTITCEHGSTIYKWPEWRGWGESHSLLILFQSEALYNILPKRALEPAEIEAIKRRLTDAKVNEV